MTATTGAAIAYTVAPDSASAQQVTWQVLREGLATDFALSDGSAMPAGFQFELGYFDPFDHDGDAGTPDEATPLDSNFDLWDAAWQPVDMQALGSNFISNTTDPLSVAPNKPIFIWAFTDPTDPFGEHLLLNNPSDSDWTFPTSVGPANAISALDPGTTAIVGAVVTQTETSLGGFEISSDAFGMTGTGAAHVQTATMTLPVPEPTSLALLMAGALTLFRRRR